MVLVTVNYCLLMRSTNGSGARVAVTPIAAASSGFGVTLGAENIFLIREMIYGGN
jgi:hypothetical protein